MDIVYIKELKIETVIGVYEWEKNIKQQVVLDIELSCDTTKAAETDDLRYAIDYAAISSRLTEVIEAAKFQLIEALAEHAARLILQEFSISHLKLSVAKPSAVENAQCVGVTIERSR